MPHDAAIQLLKFLGYSTIITYASARHADFLKSLGATHVIYRAEVPSANLPAAVKKISNSIKIVYDAIGDADSTTASVESVAEGGQVASVLPDVKVEAEGKRVFGIYGNSHVPQNREFGKTLWKHLPKMVGDGVIVVRFPSAHTYAVFLTMCCNPCLFSA